MDDLFAAARGPGDEHAAENEKRGAVFTPPAMADWMASQYPPEHIGPSQHVLDPACGDGALLMAMARRRIKMNIAHIDIATTTWGIEMQQIHRDACVENLVKMLGEDYRAMIDHRIVLGDSLSILSKIRREDHLF
jgi:type I restriction-modification system DNA methylase subunit